MKPHLLLLHGALSDHHQFDAMIPFLEDSFTIHTFDFEGHGKRDLNYSSLTILNLADNIREYAEQNQLDSFFALGYSMGGYAAYIYNDKHHGKVQKLFTLATKIKWDEAIASRENAMLDLDKMREKVPAFVAALEEKHKGSGLEILVNETKNVLSGLGKNDYLNEELLRRMDIPMHIAIGDRDKIVTIEECEWAISIMKDGQLEILQDTPHPFEKVDVAKLSTSIKQFFIG